MKHAQRESEVRLHTAMDGIIWLYSPGQAPAECNLAASDIASEISHADVVYLIGNQRNSELICALNTHRCVNGGSQRVMLGRPGMVDQSELNPHEIFARMEGHDLPASLGGWHRMTEKDYVTHALISALIQSEGRLSNYADKLLRAHPAWPALSFLPDLGKSEAAELIATIVDPRWHIDYQGPDSCARLRGFMGLGKDGERIVQDILREELSGHEDDSHYQRAQLVLDTWTGGSYVPPSVADIGPRDFLWRLQAAGRDRRGVRGMLRASQLFLRFVKEVWLDNLTAPRLFESVTRKRGRKNPEMCLDRRLIPCDSYAPTLFVPRHFFRLEAEIAAWSAHLSRLK